MNQAHLMELLTYGPATGKFHWKASPRRMLFAGKEAGSPSRKGAQYIKINGKLYLAHRVAFLYMTGNWPKEDVDHINGNPEDNRWENLRECTGSQNMQNKRCSKRNKSGLLGVSKHSGGWQASIAVNKKYTHLGLFQTPEEAHEAYKKAKQKLHTFNPEVPYR